MSVRLDRAPGGCRQRLRDDGGFTLIEVLVAFTVMAMLLSVLYRGVVMLRADSMAFDDRTGAQIVARGVLDDAVADRGLASGRVAGIRDGRRWTLVAKRLDLDAQMPRPDTDAADRPPAPSGGSPSAAGAAVAMPAGRDAKPVWRTQRLVVRIETGGRPIEIEAVHLVKDEASR